MVAKTVEKISIGPNDNQVSSQGNLTDLYGGPYRTLGVASFFFKVGGGSTWMENLHFAVLGAPFRALRGA